MTALLFNLPMPPGASAVPAWSGTTFSPSDRERPIIQYSQILAGWLDDLIILQEETIGDHHPDAVLNHYRQYSSAKLSQKLRAAEFSICRLIHLGCFLFPAFSEAKLFGKLNFFGCQWLQVRRRIVRKPDRMLLKIVLDFGAQYISKTRLLCGVRALAFVQRLP